MSRHFKHASDLTANGIIYNTNSGGRYVAPA